MDTEGALGMLSSAGIPITQNIEEAGAILVNTCGFLGSAVEESLETLREMARYKRRGRPKKLLVFGCLMERMAETIQARVPEIDAVFGVKPGRPLGEWILEQLGESERRFELAPYGVPRLLATPPHTAYLRVADGCDHECGFCIIPRMRGRLASRTLESLVSEAEALAARGVVELTLVAQDTSAYGTDLYGRPQLPELVRRLDQIEGLTWIRLHYLYPASVTDDLSEVMATARRVVPYLDMPFQHCDAGILKLMRRGGSARMLLNLVERFRAALPGLVLRTSFIVGHPGEGEAEFDALMDFVQHIAPDRVGLFRFSPEEECPSARLPDRPPPAVVEHRFERLAELCTRLCEQRNAARVGSTLQLLVDGPSNLYPDFVRARWAGQSPDVDGLVYYPARGATGRFLPAVEMTGSGEGGKISPCGRNDSKGWDEEGFLPAVEMTGRAPQKFLPAVEMTGRAPQRFLPVEMTGGPQPGEFVDAEIIAAEGVDLFSRPAAVPARP
ncbi:30S ribosomal protein S12 methylthiotransferase RimO [bacterium]|nr:30S ribosomal protein S12 methylthiotransferase RimO [bacterium]